MSIFIRSIIDNNLCRKVSEYIQYDSDSVIFENGEKAGFISYVDLEVSENEVNWITLVEAMNNEQVYLRPVGGWESAPLERHKFVLEFKVNNTSEFIHPVNGKNIKLCILDPKYDSVIDSDLQEVIEMSESYGCSNSGKLKEFFTVCKNKGQRPTIYRLCQYAKKLLTPYLDEEEYEELVIEIANKLNYRYPYEKLVKGLTE